MVRFCNKCNRAVDDLDKFCRTCGHGTEDSIDYHTYYRFFIKDENDKVLWFMKGADIAFRQEIKEIDEKVGSMYQKLFPHTVGELREGFDKVFDKKEEHKEEQSVENPPEKKEEHKEEQSVENPPEKKEEHKGEQSVEKSSEIEVGNQEGDIKKEEKPLEEKENLSWPEEVTGEEVSKEQTEEKVPEEVNDKLGMLLQEDEGQRQAVQYLINKYNKNKGKKIDGTVNNNKSDDKLHADTHTGPSMVIVPSEDVVRIGRTRGKGNDKGEPYKMYDVAIHPFIPDLLRSIEASKDGMIRVRLSDIAKKMGEKFVDKKPVTIYTGLKYTLFDYNIVVEMGSLKAIDPITKKNIKILKMRMKNPDDVLPLSILQRRGELE